MEMPIPVGKATLRALDNIVAAKRVLQGDVPSRRCTRSGLPGPTLLPRGTRKVGVVAGEERLERGLRRLVGRRRRELEHRNGVGLGVVGAAIQLVEATLLLPDLAAGVEARLLAVVPRLDPRVRGIDTDAAVVDALLDAIELALDDALGFLRQRHGVALERLEPAVDAVQLDPELIADLIELAGHRTTPA